MGEQAVAAERIANAVVMGPGSRLRQEASPRRASPGRRGVISDSNFKQHEDVSSHSRGALRPSFAFVSPSSITEGAGKAGCWLHPWVPCNKKHGGRTTGSTGAFRLSLRDGFTAYFVLSPVTGLSCHRRPWGCFHPPGLSASVGAPGPHDFAVRDARARQSHTSRPPHLTATFVTIASRPSSAVRRAELNH